MTGELGITLQLAWRNLWRNHRRTLIMVSAVTAGVWAMIFLTALMRGMVDDMVQEGIKALPGHVQIHHPDYRDDPSIENSIDEPDATLLAALGSPDVVAWGSRLKLPAVVSSERGTRGVTLIGVDPDRERDLSFVADEMAAGRFLESSEDTGLIVGRRLLERLETELGKRVVIMTQDLDNSVADRGFRVVGVFESSLAATEEGFAFAGLDTVQSMLGVEGKVSEIAALGSDYRDVDGLHERIASAAGDDVVVAPWTEIDAYLGAMVSMMDGFVMVWIVVVFLALSFGLVNTLVMAVFERVREIGLMLALGMSPRNILAQIVIESVFLLSIGLVFGNLLAFATIAPLEDGIDISVVGEGMEMMGATSVLYPALYTNDVLLANAVVIVLGILASLSPAVRASRYEPVEAIARASA